MKMKEIGWMELAVAVSAQFIELHYLQIIKKASSHPSLTVEDYQQEITLYLIEHLRDYDPAQATLEAFVFGHIQKDLKLSYKDAISYADSFNTEDASGISLQLEVESLTSDSTKENSVGAPDLNSLPPSYRVLLQIAIEISGQSTDDLALRLGVSRRRVNQLLVDAISHCKKNLEHMDKKPLLWRRLFEARRGQIAPPVSLRQLG